MTAVDVAGPSLAQIAKRIAQEFAPDLLPGTGVKTLFDIVPADPPAPLVGPFMATDAEIILYGPGGSGKGTATAWLILEYLRAATDAVIYVLDFEHRRNEWASRVRRLGGTEEELQRIHWASPYSGDWATPKGPLKAVAADVKADCDRLGVTLLVVDSYSAATTTGDAMGGQAAANEYFEALRAIGRRSLTLAHVPGNAQRFPDKPFGSVFIKNWSREMWAVEQVEMDAYAAENEHGMSYHRVELRCTKAQDRERPPHQRLTFAYEPHFGSITATLEQAAQGKGDLVHEALREAGQLLTVKQIMTTVKEMTGEALTEKQVHGAIRARQRSRRDIETDRSKFPHRYKAV